VARYTRCPELLVHMSTPETLWASRTLALLGRLQHVGGLQGHWREAGGEACRLTISAGGNTATATVLKEILARAYEGDSAAQIRVLLILSELLRCVSSADPAASVDYAL
jgi:hypothetical protein